MFDLRFYGQTLKISRTEHMTNEVVFRKETRSCLKILKTSKVELIGHTLHCNSLLSRIIEGAVDGKATATG